MDGFKEKKWFIYLGDHHEGPFSLEEIDAKMATAQVSAQNYVWADGMTDWKPMTEVAAFEALVRARSNGLSGISASLAPTPEVTPASELAPALSPAPALTTAPSAVLEQSSPSISPISLEATSPDLQAPSQILRPQSQAHLLEQSAQQAKSQLQPQLSVGQPSGPAGASLAATSAPIITIQSAADLSRPIVLDRSGPGILGQRPAPAMASAPARQRGRALPLLLLLVGLGGGAYYAYLEGMLKPVVDPILAAAVPQLRPWLEKVPGLSGLISPIPALQDVPPAEYEELKAAAGAPDSNGTTIGLAVSTESAETPAIYVAANVPDNSPVQVTLNGVTGTLLNQLSFTTTLSASVVGKLAKTAAVRYPDGKMIPQGQYNVTAKIGDSQTTKSVFLGGAKDVNYTARLKQFHDKLREKAQMELMEVEQFATTLDQNMSSSQARFSALKPRLATKAQQAKAKKEWLEFNAGWAGLSQKLNESFSKWTPEMFQKDFFYGSLYELVLKAAQDVQKVHALHHTYFSQSSVDPKAFDIQLGETTSGAQAALASLKTKIEKAKSMPPTPSGMPQREGL